MQKTNPFKTQKYSSGTEYHRDVFENKSLKKIFKTGIISKKYDR